MVNYSLIFNGTSEGGRKFHITNLSEEGKKVYMKVYNTYFNHIESTRDLFLERGILYWNYVVNNSVNRYVEFRDYYSLNIVGLFGLDGEINLKDYDYDSYAKRTFDSAPDNGKMNIVTVFNEIICQKVYSNEWVDVEENDVVVDIGFNYGLFSTTSLLKKPKRVIGFEPNPNLVKSFYENFRGKEIELYNYAISNTDSKIKFYVNGDSAMSSVKKDFHSQYTKNEIEVDAIDINTLIRTFNLEKIDYLKVDCEGSEFEIFESLSEDYLNSHIRKIAIEFHDLLESENVKKLINKLKKCGFQVNYKTDDGSPLGMIYARK